MQKLVLLTPVPYIITDFQGFHDPLSNHQGPLYLQMNGTIGSESNRLFIVSQRIFKVSSGLLPCDVFTIIQAVSRPGKFLFELE